VASIKKVAQKSKWFDFLEKFLFRQNPLKILTNEKLTARVELALACFLTGYLKILIRYKFYTGYVMVDAKCHNVLKIEKTHLIIWQIISIRSLKKKMFVSTQKRLMNYIEIPSRILINSAKK